MTFDPSITNVIFLLWRYKHDISYCIHVTKTRKRLKERFLIGRNITKRAHFRGSPLFFFFLLLFFQATYSKNRNKLLIQLILCQMFGGWRKEKGERLTHGGLSLTTKFSRPQPSHYINKRQGMGSGTVLDPATLSEAALLWKSQQSNISAELFQLCCLVAGICYHREWL